MPSTSSFVGALQSQRIWIHKYTWIFWECKCMVCADMTVNDHQANSNSSNRIKWCEKLHRLAVAHAIYAFVAMFCAHTRTHAFVRFTVRIFVLNFSFYEILRPDSTLFISFGFCLWSVRTSEEFHSKKWEKMQEKEGERHGAIHKENPSSSNARSKKMSRGLALKVN